MSRNILGSFADTAVLLPLLFLLVNRGLYSPVILFFSAGILYFFSGIFFRIPMPVQPLKSVTIAALAAGATSAEIRISAALVGICCVCLFLMHADRLISRVPARVVHQVQVGLGVLLVLQAWRVLAPEGHSLAAVSLALTLGVLLLPEWLGIPWLGLLATGGIVHLAIQGLLRMGEPTPSAWNGVALSAVGETRLEMILMLVLPQLALTTANSVLGTVAAAKAYFPQSSERVTERRLIASIGFGNVIMAVVGGLPFCHGSGGLTAHVKGGASEFWANFVIGSFLLGLAIVFAFAGPSFQMPAVFIGSLLLATGMQHLRLAEATARAPGGLPLLLVAAVVAAISQNLLWVMAAAVISELSPIRWLREFAWPGKQTEWR